MNSRKAFNNNEASYRLSA